MTCPRQCAPRNRSSVAPLYVSMRQLVPGQPLTPTLRAVLRAADRPLTNLEADVLLEVRGIRLTGQDLAAVTNRVSALCGGEVKKGRVRRLRVEGDHKVRWVINPDER